MIYHFTYNSMEQAQQQQHVVMIPSPGMGHLIPLTQLAKRLALLHHCSVTILVPSIGPPPHSQTAVLSAASSSVPSISHLFLPPVSFHDLPLSAQTELKIVLAVARSASHIRRWLDSQPAKPAALLVDLFGTDAFAVAQEFGVPSYLCFLTSATGLSLFLHTQKLAETTSCEYRDLPGPVVLPGCIPIHGRDFPDPLQARNGHAHQLFVDMSWRACLADGIIINTFTDLEPGPLNALLEEQSGRPPVYPVGPVIQSGSGSDSDSESGCLKWLDEQPIGSVLFVSFGSGGTLSQDQLNELAIGLEMSGHRFLLVARTPNDKLANGAFFDSEGGSSQDPLSFLPDGFLERTRGRGLAVASWVPQIEVLSHASTGGFLSHCGWNSILESVVHGVPVIAWPLYAEQKLNAALVCDGEVKVALRPNGNGNGMVGREEVSRVVKELMEGEEGMVIRNTVRRLKEDAVKVVGKGGSSSDSLSQLVVKWKCNNK